jgi:hypothetical protein|nr:MAG TPA: Pre-mRNA-processing-splicing factor [Caudoviricetes sp.]
MKCEICGNEFDNFHAQGFDNKIYCPLCYFKKENQELKSQLAGTTHCFDEEEHNKLKEENQELKKQLENCYCNRTDCSSRIKDSKKYDSLVQKVETQQKEFIKYLEGEINKLKEQIKNYDIWHEVGTDINFLILKKQFYLEILQKYKEIIQTKNNNSV